jgi:hypothetical protein
MIGLQDDIESGLLLPTSQIESKDQLKMEDLFEESRDGGRWSGMRPWGWRIEVFN